MSNKNIRKLVSFKTIEKILPIEGADRIELVKFGGWQSVVKKGEFAVGDKAIYFEIDTFLPKDVPQFAFLSERSSKKVLNDKLEEVEGKAFEELGWRPNFKAITNSYL